MNNEIGVINEQGYPAGVGLGYTPLSEEEQEKLKNTKETKKDKE